MAEDNKQQSVFDTDRQYLGDVYAKALLGAAQNSGQVDQLIDELAGFANLLNDLPKLRAVLESPRVPFAEKEKILDKAVGGKISKLLLNFLKVLCRKGRADCLTAVNDSARQRHDEMAGRVQATMTTAIEVDQAVEDSVASRFAKVLGKQVILHRTVDPNIVGGLMVRVGDTVYDGSITNQLKQVRASAIGRANQEIRQALDRFASDT